MRRRTGPYQRPPLSKEYLSGGEDDDLFLLSEDWCASKEVEVLLGTPVSRLLPATRRSSSPTAAS